MHGGLRSEQEWARREAAHYGVKCHGYHSSGDEEAAVKAFVTIKRIILWLSVLRSSATRCCTLEPLARLAVVARRPKAIDPSDLPH